MRTIAYITNRFPATVEWYVVEEIRELRRHGIRVLPCSVRRPNSSEITADWEGIHQETTYLDPLRVRNLTPALWLLLRKRRSIGDLLRRIALEGQESAQTRLRAAVHTVLGAYCAVVLQKRGVDHIHVHHGYFGAWVGLVAARLLGIRFSMTLHGSDLLLHARYMDTKIAQCSFCVTVSEFNRRHILARYPGVDPQKVRVHRVGVCVPTTKVTDFPQPPTTSTRPLLLAVGRLHPVKNHAFLLRACYLLRERGASIQCFIVGDGPERRKLELLVDELHLGDVVTLLGQISRERVQHFYDIADLVVLTSESEGIPLVLMEAMARSKIVLAPAITGIPELVIDGKTGFLYKPGDIQEFIWRVEQICRSLGALEPVRDAAREHVMEQFEQQKNLSSFARFFVERITARPDSQHADFVLQQI
jgi:colanic acid/amylovoran biosynthesis glycosyltransferase